MPSEEQLLRMVKAQIKRLRESVARLEAYTALVIDHKAVQDEIIFAEQVLYGLKKQTRLPLPEDHEQ